MSKQRWAGWSKRVRWSYTLNVLSAIALVLLAALTKDLIPVDFDNLIFDWYQRLDHRKWDPESPVRIVDIDDESLTRIGQWPWPRSTMAELVKRLHELGAAAVAVDLVFAEPDARSPERLVTLLPDSPGRTVLEQELKERPSNDAALVEAIKDTPTVLGAVLTQGGRKAPIPTKLGVASAGDDPEPFVTQFTGAVVPLPMLADASAGIGAINWLPDRDQIVRRVPMIAAYNEQIVPSLSLEALRVGQGASTLIVRSSNASGYSAFGRQTGINTIKVGDLEIPTDAQGALRVQYTSSEPQRFIPAWKLLSGEVGEEEINQRIIVVGTSAAGLRDERSTPIETSIPGSEIHAQVIEQILAGAWLRRPDWAPGLELLLAICLALSVGAILPLIGALPAAVAGLSTIAVLVWASRRQFATNGLLLDPVLPSLSILLTYLLCLVWLYRAEQRRRKFVREAFAHYVSPAVIERLAEDPVKLILGGETRTLTIMFCDVRGFTSMAERLDAQSLAQFMNEYLTPMSSAILESGGTIDKYIGDAIMAFWNAPLDEPHHASQAARTALAMMRELDVLNEQWSTRAKARGEEHHNIRFGIGFATGECSVGNFGSVHRFDYSVLGDRVNLASRLEGATKFYRTSIIASETTRDMSPEFAWLEVDEVRALGKSQAVRIFTLAGDEIEAASAAFATLSDAHGRMLAAYRAGEFSSAAVLAKKAGALAPVFLHGLYQFYEQRCTVLEQSRPAPWVPITQLEGK